MSGKTYTIRTILDFLTVPPELRERCMRDILLGLEFSEFAGADLEGTFTWIDDDKRVVSLCDEVEKPWLTLEAEE